MDLNYVFYRQQIERSLADSATCDQARKIHVDRAREYEKIIGSFKNPHEASKHPLVSNADSAETTIANPIMALAMTARELAA